MDQELTPQGFLDLVIQSDDGACQPSRLGSAVLMAGFFKHIGFADEMNKLIPKIGHHSLGYGEQLAATGIILSTGEYKSLNSLQNDMAKYPMRELVGVREDIPIEDFGARDAIGDGLSQMFLLDMPQVYDTFLGRALELIPGFKVEVAHLDSTNNKVSRPASKPREVTQKNGEAVDLSGEASADQTSQDKQPIALLHGKSKSRQDHLPQYTVLTLNDEKTGIPLMPQIADGNVSDYAQFPKFLDAMLPSVQARLESKLKYVAGDSALYSPAAFHIAQKRGIYLVTRKADKFKESKQAFADRDLDGGLVPIYPDDAVTDSLSRNAHISDQPMGKWISVSPIEYVDEESGERTVIPLKGLLIHNPKLLKTKIHSCKRKAEKEKEETRKALRWARFKCRDDAKQFLENVQADLTFCDIQPLDEHAFVEAYTKKSARKSASGTSEEFRIYANVTINEELVTEKAEQECLFVLVTSDVERDWTMRELLEVYRGNQVVEDFWTVLKDKQLFLPALYLHKEERIEALLWLLQIVVLGYYVIQACLNFHRQQDPELADTMRRLSSHPERDNPTLTTRQLIRRFQQFNMCVSFTPYGKAMIKGINLDICRILLTLGKAWSNLLNPRLYDRCISTYDTDHIA